jgi:DNA-binding HxlR family transcriptional regulator
MTRGYGQFCPIAKASEVFATRWTPLLLRELMAGPSTFNDLHCGVPLMSRALLAERLRQLEHEGIVEKRRVGGGSRAEYGLTPAGDAFGETIDALARWGLCYSRDRLEARDLDPGVLMRMLRRRARLDALPDHRIVLRFEFSGVPSSKTKLRLMWLVLTRPEIDVCLKDPGHLVDVLIRGDIATFVAILLGHTRWKDKVGKSVMLEGDRGYAAQIPKWFGV